MSYHGAAPPVDPIFGGCIGRRPQEEHLGRQGDKLVKLVPVSRLATVEHTAGGMVVEAEARELAGLILGFLGE